MDGTQEDAKNMKRDEFKTNRSYGEVSDAALYFLIKQLGIKIIDHVIAYDKAVERVKANGDDVEFKSISSESKFIDNLIEFLYAKDSYKLNLTNSEKLNIVEVITAACYRRKIGNNFHTKVMVGNLESLPISDSN